MAEQRNDDLLRSRQEAALLLKLDPSNLSPSDALRCDLVATLRLSIDGAQADALEGRAADLGRLIVATESLVKLLPTESPKPESVDRDPRAIMLATYMPERDEADDERPAASPIADAISALLAAVFDETETDSRQRKLAITAVLECDARVKQALSHPARLN